MLVVEMFKRKEYNLEVVRKGFKRGRLLFKSEYLYKQCTRDKRVMNIKSVRQIKSFPHIHKFKGIMNTIKANGCN